MATISDLQELQKAMRTENTLRDDLAMMDDVEGYDRMTGRYSADTPTAKISLKDLLDSKNIVSDYEYEVGHKHGGKVYRRAGGSVRGWGKATRGY